MDGTIVGEQGCGRCIARQMPPSSRSGAVPEGYPAPVRPYLGIELEPVLHVIPDIRLSSTSGSGSGQFICSRRTLASRREEEPRESMGGEDSREPSFRLGCPSIGFIYSLTRFRQPDSAWTTYPDRLRATSAISAPSSGHVPDDETSRTRKGRAGRKRRTKKETKGSFR